MPSPEAAFSRGRHRLRVRVGREVEIVGLDTTSAAVLGGVGVDGEEEVCADPIGEFCAGAERQIGVTPAGQDDLDAGVRVETRLEAPGHVEYQRRLGQLANLRAGIVAPVAGVDDDSGHTQPELTAK